MTRSHRLIRRLTDLLEDQFPDNPVLTRSAVTRLAGLLSDFDAAASRAPARLYLPEDGDVRRIHLLVQEMHAMAAYWAPSAYASRRARFFQQVAAARAEYLARQRRAAAMRRGAGWAATGLAGAAIFAGATGASAAVDDLRDLQRLPGEVSNWIAELILPDREVEVPGASVTVDEGEQAGAPEADSEARSRSEPVPLDEPAGERHDVAESTPDDETAYIAPDSEPSPRPEDLVTEEVASQADGPSGEEGSQEDEYPQDPGADDLQSGDDPSTNDYPEGEVDPPADDGGEDNTGQTGNKGPTGNNGPKGNKGPNGSTGGGNNGLQGYEGQPGNQGGGPNGGSQT